MKPIFSSDLYIDDDGYICFMDREIFWTLHTQGWEAYLPNKDMPCFLTWKVTFPKDEELAEAQSYLE